MRGLLRRPQGQVPEAAIDRPSQNIAVPDFDLRTTLTSGQVFRWRRDGSDGFTGWIDSTLVEVRQQDCDLIFRGGSAVSIRRFFSLDVDLAAIVRQIDVDPIIHAALEDYWGLRLIRQSPWECLGSFILSSFNNIVRLTGMLDRLALCFGEPLQVQDTPAPGAPSCTFRFPKPEILAKVSERVLRNCGLGFRAPYLKAAAQAIADGKVDLEGWRRLEDDPLRQALRSIPGVGEKVVECVMLFAYQRESAFPVDVWIGRAMRRWYFPRRKVTDSKVREFAREHFGSRCGWAQQVLYCAARTSFERTEPSGAIS